MTRAFFGVGAVGALLWFGFIIANFVAWIHHVVVCIQNQEWILLVVGALFFPIGMIHGWGLWFGWFLH